MGRKRPVLAGEVLGHAGEEEEVEGEMVLFVIRIFC